MKELILDNVSFKYGQNYVLRALSLEYSLSEFLCICGPNGGGKSTLLKLILGLLRPTLGQIKLFGKEPKKAWRYLGYVPQNIPITPHFPITALEVVLMGSIEKRLFGSYNKDEKSRAIEALERVGMQKFANASINALSGGERQRIYIARALQTEAKVLLLDEPTSSIDTAARAQIYALLKELNLDGVGIILVSHDVGLTLNYATSALYVANGEVNSHNIGGAPKSEFLDHLCKDHTHFCDIELALMECACKR